jgi:hypothetical protein
MEKLQFFLPGSDEVIISRLNTNDSRGFTPDETEIELPESAYFRIVLQAERKYQVTIIENDDAWLVPDSRSSTPGVHVYTLEWSRGVKNAMKSSENPTASAVLCFRNPDSKERMIFKLTMTRTPERTY